MSHRHHGVSRFRVAAAVPTLGLVAASLSAGAMTTTAASAEPNNQPSDAVNASRTYINYVAPRVQDDTDEDVRARKNRRRQQQQRKDALEQARAFDAKHSQGNPATARQLAALEAKAIKTGKSPKEIKEEQYKDAKETTEAKLLTILVEFNENAQDDFSNVMVPSTVFGDRTCVPGGVQSGPLHNNIPNPANAAHLDNNSMWVEDFSSEFYNKLLYTDEGITERIRTDLTGPDGKPGVDISGYTMKNMYEEMSQGAYTVTGEATPWVEVPHSEAWYGADTCTQDPETGEWVAGPPQGMEGHPDNPNGAATLPIHAVNALDEQPGEFPWAEYDVEDQADRDGDGNLHEPNGVIDHVVLVHAGEDKSGGGGEQGTYAIWAHSSAVTGGYEIPGTEGPDGEPLRVSNYIVQPENSGVGVFAHEYGHDLGLPDLYDTSGAADSDIAFWDLMASGSHSGPVFQSMPTHMGLWDKWVLGWATPKEFNVGDAPAEVTVGQNSRPPKGTEDGIIVNLPDKEVTLAEPHTDEQMWWSGSDQAWADNSVVRDVVVPNAADAKFWMWNNYVIESDWDFGFVEVSTDGGATWTEQKVYDAAGNVVTTPDGYGDPNGRMADYGGKKYGLTGATDGWEHHYVDLSAHAGDTIAVRLRYATDAAFQTRGWFADDFAVTGGGTEVAIEAESPGWTEQNGTWTNTSGNGWRFHSGTSISQQFYLAEWRNFDGFDEGLKYTYDTTYSRESWKVEKIRYNAPGMVVWFRDTTYGSGMDVTNHVTSNLAGLPSGGAKGGLLIVDSHFDPLRRHGEARAADKTELKNLPMRPQASNAAFGLHPTYRFTECLEKAGHPYSEYCAGYGRQPAVSTFTDAKGWVPGLEHRASGWWWRDADASTVVPSQGNQPYTTRAVDKHGEPATDLYGTQLGAMTAGSGDPADANVAYGTKLKVLEALEGNRGAVIEVTPPDGQ